MAKQTVAELISFIIASQPIRKAQWFAERNRAELAYSDKLRPVGE